MTSAADRPALELAALLQRPHGELFAAATQLGLRPPPLSPRDELAAAIVAHELAHGAAVVAEGHLAVLPEGFGFVRAAQRDYAATPLDAYVGPSQVRSLNLRDGHRVRGPVRAPKGNERHFALLQIERVNGALPAELAARVPFADRQPLVATRPLALPDDDDELRTLRLLAPWCHGHRILLEAPPAWPTAPFLVRLAAALRRARPAAGAAPPLRIALCLIDQRPEAAAAARAALAAVDCCDVVATPFAAPPDRHLALADTALARAMREVEAGDDVVLLLDSLTALVRAASRLAPPSGGFAAPGLPATALLPAKQLFAAARQCAEGGSLTIVAAVAREAGSPLDDAIAKELACHDNGAIVVDPLLVDGASAPFDLLRTRIRPEDDPRPAAAKEQVRAVRAVLAELPPLVRHRAWLACLATDARLDGLAGRLAAGGD